MASEQLEAAFESLRESDLALEEAGKNGDTLEGLGLAMESMGHVRIAVNHLAGAVARIERKLVHLEP